MDNKIKVLIVDDEKTLVNVMKDYLSKEGYETDVAYDGKQALDKISIYHPDIILLDILMPVLNGIETLKILKKQSETKNIPVIMLSNYDDREKIVETSETGSVLYFIKANSPLSLISTYIRDLLKK